MLSEVSVHCAHRAAFRPTISSCSRYRYVHHFVMYIISPISSCARYRYVHHFSAQSPNDGLNEPRTVLAKHDRVKLMTHGPILSFRISIQSA